MSLFRDIIFMVGAVVLAIAAIAGFVGIALDVEEIMTRGVIFGLTWFEVIFIVLVIAFWMVIIRLILKVREFEKKIPSIEIFLPHGKTKEALISIHNKGYPAYFSANARLVGASKPPDYEDSYPETHPFTMVWEETSSDSIEIVKGSQRRIRLVSYIVGKNEQGEETHWLRFWRYTAQGAMPIDVRHWKPRIESPEKIDILVRIDAKPALKKTALYSFSVIPHLDAGVSVEMRIKPK